MQNIVMIPGLASDAAVWRRTIAALDGDIECLVADTLSDASLGGMARRILDRAPGRFCLAGVSMGGMVALELMRVAPERVTALALVDTRARPDTVGQRAFRHLANAAVRTSVNYRRLVRRNLASLVHPSTPEDVLAELLAMSLRVGRESYVRQNRAVMKRGDQRAILPGIAVPTAVIVGQEDRLTPVALSREIVSLHPGSTLHIIPGCGHLPPIEKPTELAAILTRLLNTLEVEPGDARRS